jgi:hypothetical protein
MPKKTVWSNQTTLNQPSQRRTADSAKVMARFFEFESRWSDMCGFGCARACYGFLRSDPVPPNECAVALAL